MKNRIISLFAALLLLLPFSLAGCEKEKVPINLYVVYQGPEVTTTDKVFKAEEFLVLASYEDGTDEYVHDFEFEQKGLKEGFYIFTFSCRGYETEEYVRCHVPVFPSDKGN